MTERPAEGQPAKRSVTETDNGPASGAVRARSRAGRLANWCLLATAVLASLLAGELGLRWHARVRWERALAKLGLDESQISYIGTDRPGLYWAIPPLRNGANSRGFLDFDHTFAKPPGTFRIVVIGDSVVEGQSVGWRNSFARQLEQRLQADNRAPHFEVVTLECSGYGTSQELVLLEEEAFRYSPDLIVWSYVLNDAAHPIFGGASGDLWKAYRPVSQLALTASWAWYRLRELTATRGAPADWHERLHYLHRAEVDADIARIGVVCRAHGTQVAFLINPVYYDIGSFDAYPLRALHERLRNVAAANGLVPLDLLDAFRGMDPRTLGFPHDPWHPNLEGHRLIAGFLLRELVERRLVPALPPHA